MSTECTWKAAFTPSNPPGSLRRVDKSKQHPEGEWELHKRRIIELYSVLGLELSQVMKQMQDEEDFSASLSQYRKQLKIWNVVKYSKYSEKQLKFMLHVIHKRYREGKYKTGFRLYGRPLNPNQIERTLLRKLHGPLGKDIEVFSNVKQGSEALVVPVETPRPYKALKGSGSVGLSPLMNCSPGGLSPFTPQKSPCVRGGKMLRHLEKGTKPQGIQGTDYITAHVYEGLSQRHPEGHELQVQIIHGGSYYQFYINCQSCHASKNSTVYLTDVEAVCTYIDQKIMKFESKHINCSNQMTYLADLLRTGISKTLQDRHPGGEVFTVNVEQHYQILLKIQIVCSDCENDAQTSKCMYELLCNGNELSADWIQMEIETLASNYEADHIGTQEHQKNLIMKLLQDLPEEHDDLETMFADVANCNEAGITNLDQLLDIHT